jgi:hypothetical protein
MSPNISQMMCPFSHVFQNISQLMFSMLNSLTSKSVLAGMKNTRSEGFLLAKHTAHKCPHHDEPFSPPVAWL